MSGSLGSLGKNASDLVGDVKVTKEGKTVKYSGQAKNITMPWDAYPEGENTGHYLPIMLPADSVGQKLTLKGRKNGDKDITVDDDRILVVRLENLSGTTLTINKGSDLYMTADVAGMLPYGADAVEVLESQEFGECGKTEDWYTGLKTEWTGNECAITGTFTRGTQADANGKYSIGLKLSDFFGSRSVKLNDSTWTKEETNFIGHKVFTTTTDTKIDISCEGQTVASLTFKGATFRP